MWTAIGPWTAIGDGPLTGYFIYTLVSFGGTFFLDNIFTIYNLSRLCMLTANGIFFLARCVYVLLWRCNTSLTGLVFTRRLFLELLIFFHISSFIDSVKDSTHFLLSASTISFPVCTTIFYSFFYLSWCCHTSFICTFSGELISAS